MRSDRPTALAVLRDGIPQALISRRQWVCWRFQFRRGKWTKVPLRTDGRAASHSQPDTWTDFESVWRSYSDPRRRFDGVGYVFAADDPYCGIDLDRCRRENATLDDWSANVVTKFNTYTEASPSGRGVKLWLIGSLEGLVGRRTAVPFRTELYDRNRFFAVTGHVLPGVPRTISERQSELNAFHAELFPPEQRQLPAAPPPPITASDQEIVASMLAAKNGAKSRALWEGRIDGYPTASEADLALCSLVAFFAGPDEDRIARIARQSGLNRPKWGRQDYLKRTIARALASKTEFRKPRRTHSSAPPRITPAKPEPHADAARSGATESPMDSPNEDSEPPPAAGPVYDPISAATLIEDYPDLRPSVLDGLLRKGEVMNLVAAPKTGKTWMVHSLVLAVAGGVPWFGMTTAGGRVLLIDAELHRETLARRLSSAHRASRVDQELMARRVDVWAVRGQRLAIDDVAHRLRGVEPGMYRLIIVDALYRFIPPGGEENSNETMTQVYNALDALAERTGAAIVVVHHTTKGGQGAKSVTDVGAGGGAQSRAADTHLILRPHEVEGAVVVEAAVRSWKRLAPFVIRWTDPGWELAPDLNPADLLQPKPRKRKAADPDEAPAKQVRAWTVAEFAGEIVGPDAGIKDDILARAKIEGLSKAQAESLFKRALAAQAIHRHIPGASQAHRFSTQPPDTTLPLVGGEGGGGATPQPPEPDARGGMGGCARPPSPPPGPSSEHTKDDEASA